MSDLSYPNISFQDQIIGPAPSSNPWRDQIGVCGAFGRGSSVPTQISSLNDLASLYGLDSNAGSLFVQQAIANGSSNFTVCRASASGNPGSATLTFSSGNANVPPRIGYTVVGNSLVPSTSRTAGMQLELDYIGDAIVKNTLYSPVTTNPGLITDASFVGQGRFTFYVTSAVEGDASGGVLNDPSRTLAIQLFQTTVPGYQVALIAKNAANFSQIQPFLLPGYSLTQVSETPSDKTIIVSNLINLSPSFYGLIVKSSLAVSNSLNGVVSVGANAATTGTTVIYVNGLVMKDTGTVLPPNTNPQFLESMQVLINGQTYTQAAAPVLVDENGNPIINLPSGSSLASVTDGAAGDAVIGDMEYGTTSSNASISTTGDPNTNYKITLNTPTANIQAGVKVSFLPSVLSVVTSTNEITVEGLLFPSDVNSTSYQLLIGNQIYTIASTTAVTPAVSPNNTIGQLQVILNQPVSASLVGQPVYLLNAVTNNYQVRLPNLAQYVIGYTFDSNVGSTLSTTGEQYYSLGGTYNDGYGTYNIDNYFILNETDGGVFKPFRYLQTPGTAGVSLTSPTVLSGGTVGIEILWGNAGASSLPLRTGGQFNVPFARTYVTVGQSINSTLTNDPAAYAQGTSLIQVIQDLEQAILSNSTAAALIGTITVDEVSISPSITLTSANTGDLSNRTYWNLSVALVYTGSVVHDVLLNGSASNFGQFFTVTGGYDGATFAQQYLYAPDGTLLWTIVALTAGQYGNKLNCSISGQKVVKGYGTFQLQVTDLNPNVVTASSQTIFVVNTANVDFATGRSLAFRNISNVQAYFMPAVQAIAAGVTLSSTNPVFQMTPQRVAPPLQQLSSNFASGPTSFVYQGLTALQSFYLTGGQDYSSSVANTTQGFANGMLSAIAALQNYNIAMLCLPGIYYGDPTYQAVFDAAIASVESSTAETGLCIAVFELSPGISPQVAQILASQINSERVVLVAGSQLMQSLNNILVPNVGSSGTYAGYVLSRQPNISPAASFPGGLIQAVTSVDTTYNSTYLSAMTSGGTEVLVYDQNMSGFRFLNGRTTSSDPVLQFFSIVRLLDQVKSDLFQTLQWVRSMPNDSNVQAQVSSACDAYMSSKLKAGWFTRLASTICNSQNNSEADQIAGRLNIQLRFTPTFPADDILVTSIIDLTANFSLQTQLS